MVPVRCKAPLAVPSMPPPNCRNMSSAFRILEMCFGGKCAPLRILECVVQASRRFPKGRADFTAEKLLCVPETRRSDVQGVWAGLATALWNPRASWPCERMCCVRRLPGASEALQPLVLAQASIHSMCVVEL